MYSRVQPQTHTRSVPAHSTQVTNTRKESRHAGVSIIIRPTNVFYSYEQRAHDPILHFREYFAHRIEPFFGFQFLLRVCGCGIITCSSVHQRFTQIFLGGMDVNNGERQILQCVPFIVNHFLLDELG